MKCPLFTAVLINDYKRRQEGDDDCLMQECACWDETRRSCLVSSVVDFLAGIMDNLDDIVKKMPPGQIDEIL